MYVFQQDVVQNARFDEERFARARLVRALRAERKARTAAQRADRAAARLAEAERRLRLANA